MMTVMKLWDDAPPLAVSVTPLRHSVPVNVDQASRFFPRVPIVAALGTDAKSIWPPVAVVAAEVVVPSSGGDGNEGKAAPSGRDVEISSVIDLLRRGIQGIQSKQKANMKNLVKDDDGNDSVDDDDDGDTAAIGFLEARSLE